MFRFRPRWSFSLGTLLALVTAVAAGTWYWSLHEYQAVIVLRLQGPEDSAEFERYEREQIELICSDRVLDAVLHEPEVANLSWRRWRPATVPALRSKLDFDLPDDDEVLGIRFSSRDARTALTIVNAVSQAYLNEVEDRRRHEMGARFGNLQATLADLQREACGKQDSSRDEAEGAGPDHDHSLTEAENAALSKFNALAASD